MDTIRRYPVTIAVGLALSATLLVSLVVPVTKDQQLIAKKSGGKSGGKKNKPPKGRLYTKNVDTSFERYTSPYQRPLTVPFNSR